MIETKNKGCFSPKMSRILLSMKKKGFLFSVLIYINLVVYLDVQYNPFSHSSLNKKLLVTRFYYILE